MLQREGVRDPSRGALRLRRMPWRGMWLDAGGPGTGGGVIAFFEGIVALIVKGLHERGHAHPPTPAQSSPLPQYTIRSPWIPPLPNTHPPLRR